MINKIITKFKIKLKTMFIYIKPKIKLNITFLKDLKVILVLLKFKIKLKTILLKGIINKDNI